MPNNTLIFGDSYSTFRGYIPNGYASWYPQNEKCGRTDVVAVTQTWWHQVIQEAGLNLVLNNSWSGSPIGYTGYNNTDCSKSSSFIYRLNQLIENGFFQKNRIDTVFVFGGTNDNWCNAPLGEPSGTDLYCVLPAIHHFFDLIRKTLPDAAIYCLINNHFKPEVTNALKEASDRNNITVVTFKHIDTREGHPTVKGMQDIKEGVLAALAK
ncbi:MAG: hypothetical protein IJN61_05140 [Clostridia bacterium]|nr:hypothetical protein [Clostridia bacterium]